jgi:hypothetical protein
MSPQILSALVHEHYIEIRYINKNQHEHTDYIYTSPIGWWTELNFEGDYCEYLSFLNTMVYKNIDVYRKMAKILLEEVLDVPQVFRIQLLNAMKILDPTFTPPWINVHCEWQRALVDTVVNRTFYIIRTSYSERKLMRYVNVLQSLVAQLKL